MGTDFSKVLLNGLLDYSGVKLGQGRVLLDSDFNELTDIFDRRMRALASDVLDRATVSSTTPDAFKIATGVGGLTIGVGRLYVDGLLAECHGAESLVQAKRVLDEVLDEARFADPLPYAAQPYLPQPPALPASGTHLIYLDVWNRHVTHLEQPDLVETALGVDAGAREQVVWQVRVLAPNAGGDATCATPDGELPGWADLIAPSTGVLTTGTYEVAPVTDPCELPPTGGYRGLENQLYRVEIHNPGQPGGGATFKWSRDNASVGSRIRSIVNASEVEVESLGRDDILSLKTGDWVEFTNDFREFAQQPGEMRKITVTAANRRVTFASPLPADLAPGPFPDSTSPTARNLRVRRWDQKGKIFRTGVSAPVQIQNLDTGTSGLINVPAAGTVVILENGVTVEFGSTGAKGFRTGDYWVFAARTTDASVEKLDRARPRGIWHNYARLAIWDAAAGTLTDCRNKWPPKGGDDCSCTACVTADSHASGQFTIQAAVDKVKPTGGTVCLGPGQYKLEGPVEITSAASLRVRGQGLATLILAAEGAFAIKDSLFTAVENLAILSLAGAAAISVDTAIGLSLTKLVVATLGADRGSGIAISLQGAVADATIAENVIFAETGIFANALVGTNPITGAPAGDRSSLVVAALRIDDNILLCDQRGVVLDGNTFYFLGTRITGNEFLGCHDFAASALGFGFDGSTMTISRNDFSVAGGVGIRCGAEGVWIDNNKLVNTEPQMGTTHAILVTVGADQGGMEECHILANQIIGFGGTGIHVTTPVRALIVKQNIIEKCGSGIVSFPSTKAGKIAIENNQLLSVGPPETSIANVFGIMVFRAASATIAGNTIVSLGKQPAGTIVCNGISTWDVDRARILGNELIDIGPSGTFAGSVTGINLRNPLGEFETHHNRIEREAVAAQGPGGNWAALQIGPQAAQGSITPGVTPQADTAEMAATTDNSFAARIGNVDMVTIQGRQLLATAPVAVPSGSILGNTIRARGSRSAVEVTAGECLFNDNRVETPVGDAAIPAPPAVKLTSTIAIVSTNRVKGGNPSIALVTGAGKQASAIGNITSAGISATPALLTPFVPLNLIR